MKFFCKKCLTSPCGSGILNKLSERTAVICKTKSKKTSKKVKKTLDKRKTLCYNNKAVAPEAMVRCTLKIEQCKNSLCK